MITIESLKQHLPDTGRPWKLVDAHSTIQVYGAIKCRLKQGGYGYQKFAVSVPKTGPIKFNWRTQKLRVHPNAKEKLNYEILDLLRRALPGKEIKQ